jgi:hypothetical protein
VASRKLIRVLLCALLFASGAWCLAQSHAPRSKQMHHSGEWLRKYKDLPPEQKQQALENDPEFQHLSPERQEKLRQRLQRFNSLPPEQQQRILSRMETWEHLTPVQKQQARELYGRFRNLPPERRRMVRGAVNELRALPPDQRKQTVDSDRYKSQFTPQERELLSGVSELPLAPADGQSEKSSEEQP